jgi:hypothetical protein
MKNFERITVDLAQMSGVPCVRHLRIPVATVLRLLAGGLSEHEILSEYPAPRRKTFASPCDSRLLPRWSGICPSLTPLEVSDR